MANDTLHDISKLADRRNHHRDWLKQHHPEVFTEQKHCDEGTPERAYWHYGYAVAITDMLVYMGIETREYPAPHTPPEEN